MPGRDGRFLKGEHWRLPGRHWNYTWLWHNYLRLRRSAKDIADELKITDSAVQYWLRKHGIVRRSIAEARAVKHWTVSGEANGMYGRVGSANPNYRHGQTPKRQRVYSQSEGRAFKRAVLARDGHKCCRCGAGRTGPRTLHIHHIQKWDNDETLLLDRENALTLCVACHQWVHSKQNTKRELLA